MAEFARRILQIGDLASVLKKDFLQAENNNQHR